MVMQNIPQQGAMDPVKSFIEINKSQIRGRCKERQHQLKVYRTFTLSRGSYFLQNPAYPVADHPPVASSSSTQSQSRRAYNLHNQGIREIPRYAVGSSEFGPAPLGIDVITIVFQEAGRPNLLKLLKVLSTVQRWYHLEADGDIQI